MRIRARASFVSAIALSAWVLGSCGSTPDTGIRLEIDAALMPGHSLTRVHVRTYDFTDRSHATIDEHDFPISISGTTVPFSMSIVPRDASHPNAHLGIEVVGTLTSGPPVVANVWTAFDAGRIFVVPLVLRDDCDPPCSMMATCQAGHRCVDDAFAEPSSFATYGVDAGRDVVSETGSMDVLDVVDTGPPPMDAIDVVDASDVIDVVDVPITTDVIDAFDATDTTDATDIVDVPDVIDVPDVPDVSDVPDVVDAPEEPDVPDAPDIVDVPVDVGFGIACGMGYCPSSAPMWICGPPTLPPAMRTTCCQPYGGVPSCVGITCPSGFGCMVDPMGNAACCGPPIVP
jgi:hypothetical protein